MDGPATRLTIYLGEDDHWHHKPLYHEIVLRAFQVEVVRYGGRTE